jgi:anti-sigma regulatory factor (Ser/Thr protein kinase)
LPDVCNLPICPNQRVLLERLAHDEVLRRLCGFETAADVPDETVFSRAFAEFAKTELPQRVQQALVQHTIVTAASELARNALTHGGGGTVHLHAFNDGARKGLRLTFEDRGPGIAHVELAMKDGYTTAGRLGLGLSGAKRLSPTSRSAPNPVRAQLLPSHDGDSRDR